MNDPRHLLARPKAILVLASGVAWAIAPQSGGAQELGGIEEFADPELDAEAALPACSAVHLCDCKCGVVNCAAAGIPSQQDCGACVAGLAVYEGNPHFFANPQTGKPRIIAAYGSIVPDTKSTAFWDEAAQIRLNDFTAQIAQLAPHTRYARVWHFTPWNAQPLFPWVKSGAKYDFDQLDTVYWGRLRNALQQATAANMTSEILLFDRVSMEDESASWTFWSRNPWNPALNDKGFELTVGASQGTPEFYQVSADLARPLGNRPKLHDAQDKYIQQMVGRTMGCNVVYEVENEHATGNATVDRKWIESRAKVTVDAMQALIDNPALVDPSTGLPAYKKRLVSYSTLGDLSLPAFSADLLQAIEDPNVDVINIHLTPQMDGDLVKVRDRIRLVWNEFAKQGVMPKPIDVDEWGNCHRNDGGCQSPRPDDLPSYDTLRHMAWTIVMNGASFHIEDPDKAYAKPYLVIDNIQRFIARSGWNFGKSAPRDLWGGSCMVEPGAEWACFFPTGSPPSITVPPKAPAPGESAVLYSAQWWDPRWTPSAGGTGFTGTQTICATTGDPLTFTTPQAARQGDWVVSIHRTDTVCE